MLRLYVGGWHFFVDSVKATAKANTEILSFAQNDDVKGYTMTTSRGYTARDAPVEWCMVEWCVG